MFQVEQSAKEQLWEVFGEYLKWDWISRWGLFYDAVIVLSQIYQMAHEDRHKLIEPEQLFFVKSCVIISCKVLCIVVLNISIMKYIQVL